MANFDTKALVNTPNYSKVNMTYESIGTLQMGIGTPVLHKTIVPGDDWSLSVDQIMRLAPLSSPVFDDVTLNFRAFFVPNRILDPRWKEFITAGVGLYGSSDNEISPLRFSVRSLCSAYDELRTFNQTVNHTTFCAGVGGLADWLNFHFTQYDNETGRPCFYDGSSKRVLTYQNGSESTFDMLPFLGYQKIYDDWYRNERVQPERLPSIISYLRDTAPDERTFDLDLSLNVSDVRNPFSLWRVNYGKDRYTTALPEPVVGGDVTYGNSDPAVGQLTSYPSLPDFDTVYPAAGATLYSTQDSAFPFSGSNVVVAHKEGTAQASAILAVVESARDTIRNLKSAFKLYDFFMKDTYGGNRYVEFMQNHYNVRVPDATLDRCIYLGDHKVRISFGEVFQTSQGSVNAETGEVTGGVLGDYAGRGAAYSADGYLFNEKFLEHGQLYVIASIVPRAKYYQGIDKKFFKGDRFDYFFPEFQNIGDSELFTKELYHVGNESSDEVGVFGFAPRWSELKESLDEVHGDFLTDSMDEYHFGRVFSDEPMISSTFSTVPTINRPFSYTDEFSENYLINMRWRASAARPVQLYEVF